MAAASRNVSPSQAEVLKEQGNKAFLAKRYAAAAELYTDAIVRAIARLCCKKVSSSLKLIPPMHRLWLLTSLSFIQIVAWQTESK